MVVNDPDQDPKIQGLSNPRTICRPAVHGQNQLYAVLLCGSKRTLWDAMAIVFAVWDVTLGNRADRAQRADHNRRPRQAVRIKVTNDENGLPCFTSSSQARDEACCIRQELWRVQRSITGIKKALHSIWGERASHRKEFGQRITQIFTNITRAKGLTERANCFSLGGLNTPAALGDDSAACGGGAHREPTGTLGGSTCARRALSRRNALFPPDEERAGVEDRRVSSRENSDKEGEDKRAD